VFYTVTDALAAITDSSYTKPYVIKLRSKDGTDLDGATINKPYVWLQGDGATRIGRVVVMADGVRVSRLITQAIYVGDTQDFNTPVSDLDNIWIDNNLVTNGSNPECRIGVHVGGGSRTHSVVVSNNRLGGSNEPPGGDRNRCTLKSLAGNPGAGTVISFISNYVESQQCIHSFNGMEVAGDDPDYGGGTLTISKRNTLVCNVAPGIQEQGEDFSCVMTRFAFGTFQSTDDTCVMNRQDTGPYQHHYTFMETDQDYSATIPRSADFVNPTLVINLPAAHFAGDAIGYFYIDAPYITVGVRNPRYREIALGSGWSSSDKSLAFVDGARTPPPNSGNTSFMWDSVTQAPDTDIVFSNGASSASITLGPSPHLLSENFGTSLVIPGVALGSSCDVGEMRYDTGGSTKELCVCDPVNTWKCVPLTARRD
jgi:hypothetical protein